MRLTWKELLEVGACRTMVRRFKKLYPKGVKVSERSCVKAVKDKTFQEFDFDWAALHFLSYGQSKRYMKQRAVLRRRCSKRVFKRDAPWVCTCPIDAAKLFAKLASKRKRPAVWS